MRDFLRVLPGAVVLFVVLSIEFALFKMAIRITGIDVKPFISGIAGWISWAVIMLLTAVIVKSVDTMSFKKYGKHLWQEIE